LLVTVPGQNHFHRKSSTRSWAFVSVYFGWSKVDNNNWLGEAGSPGSHFYAIPAL